MHCPHGAGVTEKDLEVGVRPVLDRHNSGWQQSPSHPCLPCLASEGRVRRGDSMASNRLYSMPVT